MTAKTVTMLAVGDMILGMPEAAESYFALVAPTLKSAEVVFGQSDHPFTTRGVRTSMEFSHVECDPKNISAFASAGFSVITLASNHLWDAGIPGIEDTLAGFRKHGLTTVGAGMNLDEARRPAIIERGGTRFGFLAYNCIGPKVSWARSDKPGCAYVHVLTHYEEDYINPGGPPTIYTFIESGSLKAMVDDIHKLRPLCDVLVVAFHKGLAYTWAKLATYDQQVAYAAIDAGVDLIVAHSPHILKGIEQYKGKTIFHGLGDLVIKIPASPAPVDQRTWELRFKRRKEMFGVEPTATLPIGNVTIIAKCTIDGGKISRVTYLPCTFNQQRQPEILKNDERGREVFDYMEKITRAAELNARYEWDGDEVVIQSD